MPSQTATASDKLTLEEMQGELRVARSTLDRWHRQRIGPPRTYITSRVFFYRRSSYEKWLESREEKVLR